MLSYSWTYRTAIESGIESLIDSLWQVISSHEIDECELCQYWNYLQASRSSVYCLESLGEQPMTHL